MFLTKCAASTIALAACATAVQARDNVAVAGSSTVLPYASIVAEAFGAEFDYPTPVVEGGGSSTGLARFCEGVGAGTIDIATASRAIKDGERAACAANGVTDIIEVRIGYDGIVFASDISGESFAFEPVHWHIALADSHFIDGALVPNTLSTWAQVAEIAQSMGVAGDLPDQEINAFIPGTNHGTREVFEENVMLAGCEQGGFYDAMIAGGVDEETAEEACMAVRTDGRSVDIEGDYTQTLANLDSTPTGIGVFGLAFYENNTDRLQVAPMGGIIPSTDTIATGEYPVSRPLYFYIKAAHLGAIPGLQDFAEFFMSEDMAGPDGPLAEYGLVSDPDFEDTLDMIIDGETMD